MSWRDRIAGAIAGIKAYHSSPFDFEKFDPSKLLTGEGANMRGAGTYLAENPAVSGQGGQYWSSFFNRFQGPEALAADFLHANAFDRKAAADALLTQIKSPGGVQRYGEQAGRVTDTEARDALAMLRSGQIVGPRTYEVNFKTTPERLLDWDKPLAQQPAGTPAWNVARRWLYGSPETMTGGEAYRGIASIEDPVRASAEMNEAGIPGIRYLDQGSRNAADAIAKSRYPGDLVAPPQTYNYVSFAPHQDLEILAKYGLAGAAPLGAGAMSSMFAADQYAPAEAQ
jgi:hypothetical protein